MSIKFGKDTIQRRDFINGMLIAAGTAAVGSSFPMRMYAAGTTFPCERAYRKRSQRAAWRKRTIGFQFRALAARQPPHLQNQQRADFVFALRQLSGQHTDHSRQRKLRCDHRWRRNERMLGGVLLDTAAASDKNSGIRWTAHTGRQCESRRRGANSGHCFHSYGIRGAALRSIFD